MNIDKFRRICLFLGIILVLTLNSAAVPTSAQQVTGQTGQIASVGPGHVNPPVRGLEKLSPDLRDLLNSQAAPQSTMAMDVSSGEPLLVSAMVQAGADVQPLFTSSVRSRDVGGVQWVTGEIGIKQLQKLASAEAVLGIVSSRTYQKTDAPGLDDLRTTTQPISIAEMRSLLKQGGPELLRTEMQSRKEAYAARQSTLQKTPHIAPDATTGPVPSIRTIHTVDQALAKGYDGSGVVVGVVDTGVDFANPDLFGTQAIIPSGPFQGWPFAYDTVSGARYALDEKNTLGPDNYWRMAGLTQYVHTLPVNQPVCTVSTCSADLFLEPYGISGTFRWPNKSISGQYFYSLQPDLLLSYMAYFRGISYPGAWLLPPVLIVSDEQQAGKYDTVYTDANYNYDLSDPAERATKEQPISGADLNNDGLLDVSAGMLAWISDGVNLPPGVAELYPDIASRQPPAPGRLLVYINDIDGHGTACASEIAGQGRMTDPQGQGPTNPLYAGAGSVGGHGGPVIPSMAPKAKIAAFENGFTLPYAAWTLAALGMDGLQNSGDEVNIVSNSWGDSRTIEDGWDPLSRFAQEISYQTAPHTTFLVATGNGGHGYGTITAPGGGSIIDVGASTAYGAVRPFENVTPGQFVYGDVQPWSNRGPGMLGDIAPDVVAVGAWGTGAVPLNVQLNDGQVAYDVFGGTSMSTPVAAGNLALAYEAYQKSHGVWPDWQKARNILINGASDLGYDVLVQGSGNVQASRSVDIAAGLVPSVSPSQWQAGAYRGVQYPAFPAIMSAGEESTQTFTVDNPAATTLNVTTRATTLQKVGEETFTFSFPNVPQNKTRNLPNFLKDITGWINQYHPDLVRAQVSFPYSDFDVDNNGSVYNWWGAYMYDWTDLNHNGRLWTDLNNNGRVDDGEVDIDPATNLYEFNRFAYGYPVGTTLEVNLGAQALSRRHDGVFFGLACKFCGHSTTLQVRITFYQKADWPWLSLTPTPSPVTGSTTFSARMAVPQGTQPGVSEGAIEVGLNGDKTIIPVIVNVAAASPTFRIGGQPRLDTPYDNSHIFGGFNWNWRYEAGDWRSFYYDLPTGTASPGKSLVVDTRWSSPKTDVDTWIFGPASDALSQQHSNLFGPQGLQLTGGSADTYLSGGQFQWNTNTGGPRELVSAPMQDGLGMIALHNVLNGGVQLAEPLSGSVYQVAVDPGEINLTGVVDHNTPVYLNANQAVTFTSTAPIDEGIRVQAFGMNPPIQLTDQTVSQDTYNNICTSSWVYKKGQGGLKIEQGGLLDITTTAQDKNLDLDLYVFRDTGAGVWNCSGTPVASSLNIGPDEHIRINMPVDGTYWVAVHGYSVPNKSGKFQIDIRLNSGSDLTVSNLPLGPVSANQPVSFNLNYHGQYLSNTPVTMQGLVMVGTSAVPDLVEVAVTMRPAILLYPRPLLAVGSLWISSGTMPVTLTFQNQGMLTETVTAQVNIPDGLVYQTGSATGPGTPPAYQSATHTLTWVGPLADGQKVTLGFLVAPKPGFPSSKVSLSALVTGSISGQSWLVSQDIGVNMYGFILPYIRR